MQQAAKILEYGLLAWFAALALLIAIRTLRGDIESTGFLRRGGAAGDTVEPERALMMAVVPAAIVFYGYNALTTELLIVNGRPSLPDVPQYLMVLVTGSNSLFLAGKIARGG